MVDFWSFWSLLQFASLSPDRIGSFCFRYNILGFDVPWRYRKVVFAPCIWAFVGSSIKRDRVLTPYKISGRFYSARNRSDPIKLRYDVASANSALSFALTNLSLTVSGIFFCSRSELATTMSFTHFRTYIKLRSLRLT